MSTYENPANGQKVTVSSAGPFFGCLFFGCFYFAANGCWKHFWISIPIVILTLGLAWLIYPFFAPGIVRKMYEDKGFIAMSGGEASASSGMKKFRPCAEYTKHVTNVCRYYGNPQTAIASGSGSRRE